MTQSISQSINQRTNQSINQPINRLINHPTNQLTNPSTRPHLPQFEKKKAFKTKVAALEAAKTEPELVKGLDDLTQFVLTQKGLPLGVKKQQLITDIRKLKRAGKDGKYWNKDAEISYEQLIYSINYQQVRTVV